jgi:hypothetical protein
MHSEVTMKGKRAWVIGGVVLLELMLLVAVFALGVYFGRYGPTREGLVYAGPGGARAQPAQQQQRQEGRPEGQQQQQVQPGGLPQLPPGLTEPPQLIGRVRNISPEGLNLATADGPRPVLFDEETTCRDYQGVELGLQRLRQGMVIAVYGERSPDGRNLIASEIVILPPSDEARQTPQP